MRDVCATGLDGFGIDDPRDYWQDVSVFPSCGHGIVNNGVVGSRRERPRSRGGRERLSNFESTPTAAPVQRFVIRHLQYTIGADSEPLHS